ncbi:MAG: MerR family transcriptional regulator [Anaerovoracaceae bacterium]|nr:MerR family transcriptional regulator [Bacillota bacterium]MEE0517257.1 MerR family transcriptional regulator [Anaerovoracaceae bacterium]
MRIGEVSKRYDISVDNIYYYINYGLLVPQKPKGQYNFDRQTLNDLEMIIKLKEMRFSLKEIHKILSLYRISSLAAKKDIEDLKKLYREKILSLEKEMSETEKNIENFKKMISELGNIYTAENTATGLPLSMLDLLCCPVCGKKFAMENVRMNTQYIFDGKFTCECGYAASVENGILLTPNKNKDVYDTPDIDRKMYKDLPPSLISLFQHSYNWMIEKLKHMDLNGKVVIETYINAWFFMHNHQQYLDPNGKYIVVDKYPEMLLMYKKLMEQQGFGLDILFIADSSTNLPLKKGCIDLNIDYFAVNEHNFYHDTFLYDEIAPYMKETSQMLGTYFYFAGGKKSMATLLKEYPTCFAQNFSLPYFLSHMKGKITEQEDCGFTTSSGANIGFSFHSEGEKMYLHSYLASNK